MANVTTNDTKFGITLSIQNKDQKLVRAKLPMQIMPNSYSNFGLSMISNLDFCFVLYIFNGM